MKNNEEVKQASLGSQVEFETGGGEGEEEGVGEGRGRSVHRRQVDEQSSIGASTRVVPLQRSGFIGPLTLQDMILSSKWKKEEK